MEVIVKKVSNLCISVIFLVLMKKASTEKLRVKCVLFCYRSIAIDFNKVHESVGAFRRNRMTFRFEEKLGSPLFLLMPYFAKCCLA